MSSVPRYIPGHLMHPIHARRLGGTPWGWRPGTVTGVDGHTASIAYLLEDGSVDLWHHVPLDELTVGTPVRVHEQYHALEIAGEWLNVRVTGGLGDVPEPDEPELWAAETQAVVAVDLSTGRAVAPTPGDLE